MAKALLSFNDDEEKAIERVLSVLSDEIGLKPVQFVTSPVLSFPGLEIKLYQRRVLRDGEDVPLTRLEYRTLGLLFQSDSSKHYEYNDNVYDESEIR